MVPDTFSFSLRANLIQDAAGWKFGSFHRREYGDAEAQQILAQWSVSRPRQWKSIVSRPQTEAELAAVRKSVKKGCPYGSAAFVSQAAVRLKLQHTLRSRGRPKKTEN